MLPFIFADAAGFVYNNISDIKDDPYMKANPLVRGEISLARARIVLGISLALSIISFLLLYKTSVARLVYFAYLFLCLAYSGLGVRFKETLAGPLVAAFIIWVGGPFILLTEFNNFDPVTIGLVLGSWLVFIGREILHTISDYESDMHSGYRTFAVRVGLRISGWLQNIAFIAGAMFLTGSLYAYFGGWSINTINVLLSTMVVLSVAAQLVASLSNHLLDPRAAYFLIRVFYIAYAGVILQFPPLVVLMFVWAFCTTKRS